MYVTSIEAALTQKYILVAPVIFPFFSFIGAMYPIVQTEQKFSRSIKRAQKLKGTHTHT